MSGLAFYPIMSKLFCKFNDKGWLFSKFISIGIIGLIVWLMSYVKILPFLEVSCYVVLAIIIAINVAYMKLTNKKIKIDYDLLERILISEIIFSGAFLFWTYIRSYHVPISNDTEQFMNYGFMNKISNTLYFPAEDIWFSGYIINYYYFGQYMAAFIVKMSFLNVKEGYGMMLALVSSLTFALPFSIGLNLAKNVLKNKHKEIIAFVIAIITGLSISLAGTMYYPIYKWIIPREEGDTYSYWEAVRYIGYRPETNDKTITDIPAYSNIAQDLHAHYSDTIFVFTMLALLLALILKDKQDNTKKRLYDFNVLILGIILGIQKMTNYWDFPIYLVVLSAILIANNLIKYKINKKNILVTIAQIIEIVALEELVSLPFSRDLYISATKVCLTHVMSPFYKLAVLWALPTICVLFNLFFVVKALIKKSNDKFMDKVRKINVSDIYIVLIGLCAIGLIILPEIIYLKDIYGDEYKRANTMFKLTYQAFIMFGISTCYVVTKFAFEKGKKVRKIISVILLILQLTTLGYGINGIKFQMDANKNTRDFSQVEDYIKEKYPDDYDAIQWINKNIDKKSVFVENVTGSYNPSGRISVFTGNPVVLAWHGHEWIWRAGKDYNCPLEELERWNDINAIYTCNDVKKIKDIVNKYNISYIYIGNIENSNQYHKIDAIIDAGEVVYQKTDNYAMTPVYIVKVD